MKLAKENMNKLLQFPEHGLTDEELMTLFREVQGLLNQRPLVCCSSDLNNVPPLTPAHFILTGKPVLGQPPLDSEGRYDFREHRDMLDEVMRQVPERLLTDFHAHLRDTERRWEKEERELHEGDAVVLTTGRAFKPGHDIWNLGRIVKLHPGSDGRVRSVDIQIMRPHKDRKEYHTITETHEREAVQKVISAPKFQPVLKTRSLDGFQKIPQVSAPATNCFLV